MQNPTQLQRRRSGNFHELMQNLPLGILCVDENLQYSYANDKWCQMLGCTLTELMSGVWYTVLSCDDQALMCPLWLKNTKSRSGFKFECETSSHVWVSLNIEPNVVNGVYDGYIITASDITEHKVKELKLHDVAYKDSLTGLYNRAFFDDQLTNYVKRYNGERIHFALAIIDVDNFKTVNDTHGHEAGDDLLQSIARRLQLEMIDCPGIIARWGGDEFVMLWALQDRRQTDCSSKMQVEQKMKHMFSNPDRNIYSVDGMEVEVSLSVGVAVSDPSITSTVDIFRKADKAMYQTKQKGKDNFTVE